MNVKPKPLVGEHNLILGKCLDVLPDFDNDQFDLCLTSPPYNMNLRIRDGKYVSRQIVKEISTKYDDYSDNLSMEDYYALNKSVIFECLRVSKLVFYNIQMITGNKPALFKLLGYFHEHIKELIIWDKGHGIPAIGEGVLNSRHELIVVLSKLPDAISRKFEQANFDRGTLDNVWDIKREHKKKSTHGAVMPLALADKVIANFTKEGDNVLDPFMGTGTTGVASVSHNRKFTGIEMSECYLDMAKLRLQLTRM